jgi:hypothetical protein
VNIFLIILGLGGRSLATLRRKSSLYPVTQMSDKGWLIDAAAQCCNPARDNSRIDSHQRADRIT